MGKSFLLVIAITLIPCIFLPQAALVGAQTGRDVDFHFTDSWMLQLPDDKIGKENYTMQKGIHFGVCRMDETVGEPELRLSFKPLNDSLISEIMNIKKEDGNYTKDWTRLADEKDCFDGGIGYKIEQKIASPFIVSRRVDRIFFDSRGIQRSTIDVTPLRQLNRLEVDFEIRPTDDVGIRVLSPHAELNEYGDMARFHVDNPSKGATYSFTLDLEITPKRKQVSFKPYVWVSADLIQRKEPMIEGRLLKYDTGFGEVVVEAKDDMVFHPSGHERVGVWMQGISTTARLILPGAEGGNGLMGITLTNDILLIIISVAAAIVLLVASEFVYRRLKPKAKAKSLEEQLRDLTNEERKIRGMKKNIQREYFKGRITSQAFNKMTMEYEEKLMGIISKKDDLRKKAGADKSPAPGK